MTCCSINNSLPFDPLKKQASSETELIARLSRHGKNLAGK
jgi:hypothetical protein